MSFLKSFTDRVRQGLLRTRDLLDDGLDAVLAVGRPVDEALLEELEEVLIAADLGAAAAGAFVTRVRDEIRRGRAVSSQDVKVLLRAFVEETLSAAPAPLDLDAKPTVILMLGVNGAGKTTSTGKLAASLKASGKSVMIAAADTFRAAAIEQLEEWGRRAQVEVIRQAPGADPSAVVFDALKAAHARGIDVLLVDTAGRLHTKTNLMDELIKLKKVIARQVPGAPHECLMVIEAPTGQNGLQQAKMFHEAVGLTGLILTKLDGTAKGGIVIPIYQELGVPIKLVGRRRADRGSPALRSEELRGSDRGRPMSDDQPFMAQALDLALRGRGLTSPNPVVGALVVEAGAVVGQGITGVREKRTPRSWPWPKPVREPAGRRSTSRSSPATITDERSRAWRLSSPRASDGS